MKISITRVYHGGGRRFFTLRAACNKEAVALVNAHMFKRHGYVDHDAYNPALVARVARLLERQHRMTTP